MKLTRPGIITVAAHRGDSYNFCENTMPAFRSAIAAGADMIETDVHLTSDGMPVLIHDNTLDRTTNGTGPISGHTYEQLQRLNAGEPGEFLPIPRLEELLALLADTNVTLNIEIKEYAKEGNIERMRSSVDQSVALVRRYGMAGRVLFNSFDAAVLEYADSAYHGQFPLHGFYPYAQMYNVSRDPTEYLTFATLFDDRRPEHYSFLLSHGIEPWMSAGVTRQKHLCRCAEMGATLVTTNFPADCLGKLQEAGWRSSMQP